MTDDTSVRIARGVAIIGLEATFETDTDDVDQNEITQLATTALHDEFASLDPDPRAVVELDDVQQTTDHDD